MENGKIEITIPLEGDIKSVIATILLVKDKHPILAFVHLDFGFIKIKGVTVKKISFHHDNNEVILMDMPAYRTGFTFTKSAFIADKRMYDTITNVVLQKVEDELIKRDVPPEDNTVSDSFIW